MERVVLKYNCFIVLVELDVWVRLQPEAELWAYLACVRKMRVDNTTILCCHFWDEIKVLRQNFFRLPKEHIL